MKQKIELLAPAGDLTKLRAAVDFGADAVYMAGKAFGMRTSCANFSLDSLAEGIRYAHGKGAKVYITCNIVPVPEEMEQMAEFAKQAAALGADAFIVSDLGAFRVIQRAAPGTPLHISTQAGVTNHETATFLYELGAQRVILARELSLKQIRTIREKTPQHLELETFVHGSMCLSVSGRCVISDYLTGRGANHGDCAQPCRWKYRLVEEKRPGEYLPVVEENGFTYLMNSRDLCMLPHLPELAETGVVSFKIEGRAKSAYYAAAISNVYRFALDQLEKKTGAPLPAWALEELEKVGHRPYSTGFFFGGTPGQETVRGGTVQSWEVCGICTGWKDGWQQVSQRNRFFDGETLEALEPGGGKAPVSVTVNGLRNQNFEPIPAAPHAAMTVYFPLSTPLAEGTYLRRKIE